MKAVNASAANQANLTEETEPKTSKYRIISDISVQLRKKRDASWPLREKLHKLNITTRMRHLAVLWVVIGDEVLRFPTVCEAKDIHRLNCEKGPTNQEVPEAAE